MRAGFFGEGSSDLSLVHVLRRLCQKFGIADVDIEPLDNFFHHPPGHAVEDKLRALRSSDDQYDALFVHRDADSTDPTLRRKRIQDAAARVFDEPVPFPIVPVVPVQEMEAWLLADEPRLRAVAGSPQGRPPLSLPRPGALESVSDPKGLLRDALRDAVPAGRQRKSFNDRRFNQLRRLLLENLDIDGPVTQLPAWQQLERDIQELALSTAAD